MFYLLSFSARISYNENERQDKSRFCEGLRQLMKGHCMSSSLEKILVVDDSEMNREILKDMLGEEYEIVEAEDGIKAIEIMKERHKELSLVLLDMVMPEMDGLEVLATMGENHWLEDLPVIMISAESGAEYIHKAYELGARDYIVRPFDAVVVHSRTANTINLYARQRKIRELMSEQFDKQAAMNDVMETNYKRVMKALELNRAAMRKEENEDVKATLKELDDVLMQILEH